KDVIAPASVTYLILLHSLIVPGHHSRYSRIQRIVVTTYFCHLPLMNKTLCLLEAASDFVEPESVIAYFKTAAVATFVFAGCFFDPDLTAALAARFRCTTGVSTGLCDASNSVSIHQLSSTSIEGKMKV
ncbi:hypothetical protein PENTCL1PPCAC_24265, partial [Pristionchus entomophagus]